MGINHEGRTEHFYNLHEPPRRAHEAGHLSVADTQILAGLAAQLADIHVEENAGAYYFDELTGDEQVPHTD